MMVIRYVSKTMMWWTVEVLDIGSCGCYDYDDKECTSAFLMTKMIYSM